MSSNNSNNTAPVCPFFNGTERNGIICEGTSKLNTIHLVFQLPDKRQEYYKNYCCSLKGYKQCYISQMFFEIKYKE